jgi:hypothetical protein
MRCSFVMWVVTKKQAAASYDCEVSMNRYTLLERNSQQEHSIADVSKLWGPRCWFGGGGLVVCMKDRFIFDKIWAQDNIYW